MSFLSRTFPYPFFGREGDFPKYEFEFELEPSLGEKEVSLVFSTNIMETPLEPYIKSGEIVIGLDIFSPESFHRSFEVLDPTRGLASIPLENLAGEVRLTPVLVNQKTLNTYKVKDANAEFGQGTFMVLEGDIVGAATSTVFYIELDQRSPKSIVRVEQDSTMPDYEYRFELRSNQISIIMGQKARSVWEHFYGNPDSTPFLVTSILKDCILMAMQDMALSDDRDSMYWSRHLGDLLEEMEVDFDDKTPLDRLNQIAQSLLSEKGMKRLFARVSS